MLDRMVAGQVPAKHHITFEQPDGSLYWEECLTRQAFDGPYSILYHRHRPHEHMPMKTEHGYVQPRAAADQSLAKRHFKTQDMEPLGGPPIDCRLPLIFNKDVIVGTLHPSESDPVYAINSDGDDLYFIFKGAGVLRTPFGDLPFKQDDYVMVPRGVAHRFILEDGVEQHWLSIECMGDLGLLKQWRNPVGQLRMDAPYCHRDFERPEFVGPVDDGVRELVVKRAGSFHGFKLRNPLTDVVGWDGTVYPWVFPILNFQPRAGLVHLPPDWHGTFGTRGALICSFVPRAVDFHPQAIPCPYPHHSVDVDEFLFYVRGNFTSRKGVGPGSVSMHPRGIAHGPHPGAYQSSVGHRETTELAVMLDTVEPLVHTTIAAGIEDSNYMMSFLK